MSESEEPIEHVDDEVIAEVDEDKHENDPLHELQEQELRTVNDALKMQAVLLEEQREHHRLTQEQVERCHALVRELETERSRLSTLLAEEQQRKETNTAPIDTEPKKQFSKLGY